MANGQPQNRKSNLVRLSKMGEDVYKDGKTTLEGLDMSKNLYFGMIILELKSLKVLGIRQNENTNVHF